MLLLLKPMLTIKKKLDQMILDTGPGVLSHILPIWMVHMSSGAGQVTPKMTYFEEKIHPWNEVFWFLT
jgi:hypothetical protein